MGPNLKKLVESSRFPYTYHHDWYRSHYHKRVPLLSRGEVGYLMRTRIPDEQERIKETENGAYAYLFENYSKEILQDIYESENPAETFAEYAKYYKTAKEAKFPLEE